MNYLLLKFRMLNFKNLSFKNYSCICGYKKIPAYAGMKNRKPHDVALRHTTRRAFQTNQPKLL